MPAHQHLDINSVSFILAIPFFLLIILYGIAVIKSNQSYRQWPWYHTTCWISGNVLCLLAVAGPLAEASHQFFSVHMVAHLLLGMIGPLFMVLAKPVTLLLRSLPIKTARKVTTTLKKRPFHLLLNPLFTTVLNIGGLWLLYRTELFTLMHHSMLLYIDIHAHIFLAGYFFTASIIYIDKLHQGYSFLFRAIILILALAGHQILAKSFYGYPPSSVEKMEAEKGSMIMYYGGDVVDLVIIIIFCYQWFKVTKPKRYQPHSV